MKKTSINNIISFLWQEFLYGGHIMSLGAASVGFVTAQILDFPISWDGLLALYLFVQPIYVFDRIREFDIDYLTNHKRNEHIQKYREQGGIIISLYVLLFLILMVSLQRFSSLFWGLVLLILGLFYSRYFKRITSHIIAFKDLFVALFFVIFILYTCHYYSYPGYTITTLVLGIFVFIKSFIIQIFFDIKDIEGDRQRNLHTIPVLWGKNSAIFLITILSLLCTVIILAGIYFKILPLFAFFLSLTFFINAYLFYKVRKHYSYIYVIILGTEYMIWVPLLPIGKIFF